MLALSRFELKRDAIRLRKFAGALSLLATLSLNEPREDARAEPAVIDGRAMRNVTCEVCGVKRRDESRRHLYLFLYLHLSHQAKSSDSRHG